MCLDLLHACGRELLCLTLRQSAHVLQPVVDLGLVLLQVAQQEAIVDLSRALKLRQSEPQDENELRFFVNGDPAKTTREKRGGVSGGRR